MHSTQPSLGGGLKCQSNFKINGENKRLKGKTPQPTAQALQPIFKKIGSKLKLSTLLQHAIANVNELLGPDNRRTFAEAILLGC